MRIPSGAARRLLILFLVSAAGRCYGQNHVIIRDFDWKIRSTEHFDIYYYDGSEPLLNEAAEILENAFKRVSKALDIQVEAPPWAPDSVKKKAKWERRPFFLYASPNDFQQSNIADVGDGTGGITEPFKDRFMVYNDGTRRWLDEVITHEFVHIMQFHVLVSGFWRSGKILKTIVYPLWMMEGMPGVVTHEIESSLEELTIRDAATSGTLLQLTRLEHFGHLKPHQIVLAYKQGAAALEFLGSQFGQRKIGDMLRLFETRLETSQVLNELIGLDAFQFDDKYREFVETKYKRMVRENKMREPDAYGAVLTHTPDNIPQFNTTPVFSPDARRMYYLTTSAGHPPQIREMDLRTGRARRLKIPYIPIENVPMGNFANISRVLAISRDGSTLAVAGTKNHRDSIFLYDLRKNRLEKRPLPGFMTVSQPQFSPDGRKIAFSGMKESFTDLYLYDLQTRKVERLTEDPYDDEMPVFTPDGGSIIYSAEIIDPLDHDHIERRLYRLDLKDRSLTRLENSGGEARDPSISPDGKRVLFILNDGQSWEVCELDLESGVVNRLTRTIGGSFTPVYAGDGEIAFSSLRRGNVHIYKGPQSDFLAEKVASTQQAVSGPAKFKLPGMGSVSSSTAPVSLSPQRPYRFDYSTDLFFPAFFFSSVGGFFWTSYWQGSDMTGNHQNSLLVDFHSAHSFDYVSRYQYSRYRPQFVFGADGMGRQDLIDESSDDLVDKTIHSQFAGASYPLDRYHRVEAFVESDSERRMDTTMSTIEHREARAMSFDFARDTVRGRYLVATAGDRLKISYTQLGEVVGGSQQYYVAGAEANKFVPLGSQSTLALRAVGFQSLGADHPQLILGGLGGVRGYARSTTEDFGNRMATVNAEWRFPVLKDLNYYMWYFFPDFYFKSIFGSIFADAGYAWNDSNEVTRAQWRSVRQSVGLGMKIYTFILQEFPLVVSMDYAHRTTQNGGIFYVYLGHLY